MLSAQILYMAESSPGILHGHSLSTIESVTVVYGGAHPSKLKNVQPYILTVEQLQTCNDY